MKARVLTPLLVLYLAVAAPSAAAACAQEKTDMPQTTPDSVFVDNGDGTVSHTGTGLMWMRCSLGQSWNGRGCTGAVRQYTWQQAVQAAVDINSGAADDDGDGRAGYAGRTDWRLPDKMQLESIIEEGCHAPAINATFFPDTPSHWYWSATPSSSNRDIAWLINFQNGYDGADAKSYAARVRLVRMK